LERMLGTGVSEEDCMNGHHTTGLLAMSMRGRLLLSRSLRERLLPVHFFGIR
jgi:hypothetical protein